MKKAFVYTFGCKVNQYESQQLIETLQKKGYEITDSAEEAELSVVNSCTVTAQSDSQCRNIVRQISKKNPKSKIVLTGCYAKRSRKELENIVPNLSVISDKKDISGTLPSHITRFDKHSRAFLKIQDGCNAFCSYCIVPYIRPKLSSKPINDVVNEIKTLVSNGYSEIVLTGIHIGKYEYSLTELLRNIVSLQENFRIRLSSIEINEISPGLIKLMADFKDKLCCHLHIPLQSASNKILKKMNRNYAPKEFSEKMKLIYDYLPDTGITTDIIVGFPGEKEEDFKETLNFLSINSFSRLHVFKYSERPNTPATNFQEKVPFEIVKERSKILAKLDSEFQENFWRKFVGKIRPCVLEGTKHTLLTDNYIRLNYQSDLKKIMDEIGRFMVFEHSNMAWGMPV